MPARKLARVAVDHQGQRGPAVAPQPSHPVQTRHRSVDQRSFGAAATDGIASIRGRMPIGRLRTCQPVIWKILCTVFLLKPRIQATVRSPKGTDDQQPTNVALAHLRGPAQPVLAAARVLSRREADPGGEVPPLGESLHRWCESGDRRRRYRSHSRDRRQPPCRIVSGHAPARIGVKARGLPGQLGDLVQQQSRQVAHCCWQHAVIAVDNGCEAPDRWGPRCPARPSARAKQ